MSETGCFQDGIFLHAEVHSGLTLDNVVESLPGYISMIDTDNNVEFILTAVVYHNENETMNDDTYEYDNITIPFLAELGRKVYNIELARDKNYLPDLSRFIN